MGDNALPPVFLSHAHEDKLIARCAMRYLAAYGVHVWLDERELRLGTELDSAIARHIKDAGAMLVIASTAAASSSWVAREIDLARQSGKSITPLFIENVKDNACFREHLGIDATHPASFADAVYEYLKSFTTSLGDGALALDGEVLRRELGRLVEEEADLAPLVHGCLDSQGLHQDNVETVKRVPFYSLDFALNALHALLNSEQSAWHAAYGFRWVGAGRRALTTWVLASRDGGLPLVTAVGEALQPTFFESAIELLRLCDPPNNHALYSFIAKNASALTPKQVAAVVRLTTWPVRSPEKLGDVLGWVAWRNLPPAPELPRLWCRWIESGAFDRDSEGLARYLKDASEATLSGIEGVETSLGRHVRSLMRSGEKDKVWTALAHLRAAADVGAPVFRTVLAEVSAAYGTREWHDWEERNRDEAEEMSCHVASHIAAATTDREWLEALERAKRDLSNRRELERMIRNSTQSRDAD